MSLDRSLPRLLLTIAVGMLLFAQITGLHRHFHTEMSGSIHPQQSELHFGDAGLHADEHQSASAEAMATHHPHADIEIKVLGEAFAKLSTHLSLQGILLLIVLVLLRPNCVLRLRHEHYAAPAIRPHPFVLHPPANGPPALIVQLV